MLNLPPEKVKEILTQTGIITPGIFDEFEEEARQKKQNVVDVLTARNIINQDYFLSLLAEYLGYERVNLDVTGIDEQVLYLLPEEVARQRRVILIRRDEKGIFYAAMEDPSDLETIEFLEVRLKGKIKPLLASESDLARGFSIYSKKLTQSFKKVIEDSIQKSLQEAKKDIQEAASDLPIIAIVDNILAYGISARASDVHIEALEDAVLVRHRVDGILHELIRIPKEVHAPIVARIKILGGLRVDEHVRPQDGRFRYKMGGQLADIRVSVIPTFYGEKVVMRLLTSAQKPVSLSDLGMLDDQKNVIGHALQKSYGMILVCGPTGAGKTTTMYSMLNILNRPEVNIVTVEDPIEYDMRYVNQIQVNPAAGITFSSGLRSILRQDPNIVMVGEIRDGETANIAVQASLTGHLVLSSLHTNDALTSIPRLIDMGVPPFLVAVVLSVVSSQRLARKIHLACIESYVPDPDTVKNIKDELRNAGVNSEQVSIPKLFYRGKGCDTCHHIGYLGRIGIFEILHVTEAIRKLILSKDLNMDALRDTARREGMITMFEDGLRKVERGMTTIEEIFRVIKE